MSVRVVPLQLDGRDHAGIRDRRRRTPYPPIELERLLAKITIAAQEGEILGRFESARLEIRSHAKIACR